MTELLSQLGKEQQALWRQVEVVATDIDGTLTTQGRIGAEVVDALSRLRRNGVRVCLVTGRPSGWVQGLLTYLPADAAIAENGGVIFLGPDQLPLVQDGRTHTYVPCTADHSRDSLRDMFHELQKRNQGLLVTEDNLYRLSDFTFHANTLTQAELASFRAQVEASGLAFTWSTIHAHIMPPGQSKATAVQWLLSQWGASAAPASTTLTVGDSPNDASMFCSTTFPNAAGVANILKYRDVMENFPAIISRHSEGSGFLDIVDTLLSLKRQPS